MEAVAPKSEAAKAADTQERQGAKAGRKRFLVLGLLALVVAIAALAYKFATAHEEETDDAQIEADVVPLAARVGGAIEQVTVKDNQQVKKGQLILVLDDSDYKAKAAQADAQLATAQAQARAADAQVQVAEADAKGGFSTAKAAVSGSSVGVSSAEAQIAAARASVLHAQAEQHKARLDLDRAEQLRKANAIPQQMLDNAQIGVEAADAQLAQAKAQLTAAEEAKDAALSRVKEAQGRLNQSEPVEEQVATAHAQADLAHARVKAAEAALVLAQNQVGYTRVYAPADGMMSRLDVYQGELIQPGQAIAELVPDQTYVVANFKETQITDMRKGEPAEITVDAYPGVHLKGKVLSLSGGTGARFSLLPPDNASGNFVKVVQRVPVRIGFVDPPKDLPLRAGLSADVTVYTDSNTSSGSQGE